jgi:YesN/AraC family two-component response regulator
LILSKIEEDKNLTRTGITISELGNTLNIPPHRISTTLNKNLNKSFNDVINEARIRKSKKLIQNNAHNLSLEGIGIEVGFSNRASFYRWFKKIEACTPKEFEMKK